MAKKIYTVTFADGTIENYINKKAFKALAGITSVTANGEDITTEFVKEDKAMAENTIIEATAIEAEAEQEVVETIEEPGPKNTLLFIASRGKSTFLRWYQIPVTEADEMVKVKGCAALVPLQVAEAIGDNKFVSWLPQEIAEKFVTEGKPVRGMASTISDVFNRYIKVTELEGADKVNTVYNVFRQILESIEAGNNKGGWEHIKAEVEAQDEDAISTAIEDIEAA